MFPKAVLRVERGQIKTGEEVEIVGLTDEKRKVVVTGLEMFRKTLDFAEAGDNVGVLLRGVQRTEIQRGQVLAKRDVAVTGVQTCALPILLHSSTTIVRSSISEQLT